MFRSGQTDLFLLLFRDVFLLLAVVSASSGTRVSSWRKLERMYLLIQRCFLCQGVRFLRFRCVNFGLEVGDTFLLYAFGIKLFFTFSPSGLKSLYKVRRQFC